MLRKVNWRNTVQLLVVVLLVIQIFSSFPVRAGDDFASSSANDLNSASYSIWHLKQLPENRLSCEIVINHAGGPTYQEVLTQCGKALASAWQSTQPCVYKDFDAVLNCKGYTMVAYRPGDTRLQQPYLSTLWNSKVVGSNLPLWLSQPDTSRNLATDVQLVLLAGHLISSQLVDAVDCPAGGLLTNGAANPCGMQKARQHVTAWQNQFDPIIYQTALQYQVPPLVLKRLFIQESQFWPATKGGYYGEYGLGHITELGADTLLYWNQDFFNRFCSSVYSSLTCSSGYFRLGPREQATLRGAVVREVRVDCEDCPLGVDVEKAAKTIPIFAQALVANAYQVEQVLYSFTASSARELSSYEDLWRFTLANYNGGVGCFRNAVRGSLKQGNALRWELVAGYFSSDCRNVLEYVDRITDTNLANSLPEIFDPGEGEETGVMMMDLALIGEAPVATATPSPIEIVSVTPAGQQSTPASRLITVTLPADFTPQPRGYPQPTQTVTQTVEIPVISTPTSVFPSTQLPTATPTVEITSTAQSPTSPTPSPTVSAVTLTPAQSVTPLPTATPTPSGFGFLLPTPQETMTLLPKPSMTPEPAPTAIPGVYAADQILVKFFGISAMFRDVVLGNVDAAIIRKIGVQDLYLVKVDPARQMSVLQALNSNILVEFAEPDFQVELLGAPADPLFPAQTNLEAINVLEAWNATSGSHNVTIAVIDTGSDMLHPDLQNQYWQNSGETGLDQFGVDRRMNQVDDDANGYVDDWQGWNFVDSNGDPQDKNGHGTLVTGVIGAESDNLIGISGIARNAQLIPLKIVNTSGTGFYSDVIAAIFYAVDRQAEVINISLGGLSDSFALKQAVDYAYSHDVLVVAAAGNSGGAKIYYPAAYSTVLAVSASDENNQRAADASFGNYLDLLAPGVSIISTQLGGDYTMFSGSSAAAAHVSGVAALMAGHPQFASAEKISHALVQTALDLGVQGPDTQTGYGLLAASRAISYYSLQVVEATATKQPGSGPISTIDPGQLNINANTPLSTPTLRAVPLTAIPAASDPHVAHTSTTSNCAACHRSHTSSGPTLRANWPEEQVCFGCHTSTGPGSNIQPSFYPAIANTTTAFYKHDTASQVEIHSTFEVGDPANYGGTNRHVECEDCHQPHYATRAQGSAFATPEPGSAPLLKRVENGVSGIDPVYATGIITPTNYVVIDSQLSPATGGAVREFQVCLKCHSSYTTLPTYDPAGWAYNNQVVANGLEKLTSTNARQIKDSRDLAKEFSPNRTSYHPVMAVGRHQTIFAASFVAGWSATSMVYCSDCHTNNTPTAANGGIGPHGSSNLHILAGANNYITVENPGLNNAIHTAGEVCFKCHQANVYSAGNTSNTWFRKNGGGNLHGDHNFASCYTCHNSHGSGQLHLINFNTAVVTLTAGYNSETAWTWDGTTGTCYISCHGVPHGAGKSYQP